MATHTTTTPGTQTPPPATPAQRQNTALQKALQSPLVGFFAEKYGQSAEQVFSVLMQTVFPKDREGHIIATVQQFMAFLVVAKEYDLNPWTREIYAFPSKRGGVVPVVPIDGWVKLVNRPKDLDGVKYEYEWSEPDQNGKKHIFAITCKIKRKGMAEWVEITEYFDECVMYENRNGQQVMKDTWNKWPVRMLRHKAYIQCARIAYGLSGIYDEEEAYRIVKSDEEPNVEIQVPQRVALPRAKAPEPEPSPEAAAMVGQMVPEGEEEEEMEHESETQTETHAEPPAGQQESIYETKPETKDERPEPKQRMIVPEDLQIGNSGRKKVFAVMNSAKARTEKELYAHIWLEYGLQHIHQVPKTCMNELLVWLGGDALKLK